MIIYNVTLKVEHSIADEWLVWMKEAHLPMVMNTGCFTEFRFFKIHADDEEGKTFTVQYYCESKNILDEYLEKHAPSLRNESEKLFGGKYIAFRTTMEMA